MHDEAQRDERDDSDHLGGIRRHASVRADRSGAGLHGDDRRAGKLAEDDHRLRRDQHAVELRRAGRIRRHRRHHALPRQPWRRPPQRLPDPEIGARHQSGDGANVRARYRRRQLRRQRQRRCRRPQGQGRAAFGQPRLPDDHLPIDARRVRGSDQGHLRDDSCARRPGVHGRRQPQCAGRPHLARPHRRRRQPHEPAQNLRHPARRRRTGHGADWPQGPSGAVHGRPRDPADR